MLHSNDDGMGGNDLQGDVVRRDGYRVQTRGEGHDVSQEEKVKHPLVASIKSRLMTIDRCEPNSSKSIGSSAD